MLSKKSFVLLFFILALKGFSQPHEAEFNRSAFYRAFESNDSQLMSDQLRMLESSHIREKEAYQGALTMKKGGLMKAPADRISSFKAGKAILEKAIKEDSLNAEYRFLRLAVQENCPAFLGYHSNKMEDANAVKKSFKKFSPEMQQTIRQYSKTSKALKPADVAD